MPNKCCPVTVFLALLLFTCQCSSTNFGGVPRTVSIMDEGSLVLWVLFRGNRGFECKSTLVKLNPSMFFFPLHSPASLCVGLSHKISPKYIKLCRWNAAKCGKVHGVWMLLQSAVEALHLHWSSPCYRSEPLTYLVSVWWVKCIHHSSTDDPPEERCEEDYF